MKITINGTTRHVLPTTTVAALVHDHTGSERTAGIAVARNGKVVPSRAWNTRLEQGDVVDILTAIQGG